MTMTGRRRVRTCSRSSLRTSSPSPFMGPPPPGAPLTGRLAPTSCRKTSSSVGRTRSKRANRTPDATTIGSSLRASQLRDRAPTPGPGRARLARRCSRRARGAGRATPRSPRPGPVRGRARRWAAHGAPGAAPWAPSVTSRPRSRMATRSQMRSTSLRMCVLMRMVARAAKAADELQHVAPAGRIEGADGLVEEDDGGPRQDGLTHAETLAHAARVAADAPLRRIAEADDLEHLVDARRAARTRQAVGPTRQLEQLSPAHPGIEAWLLAEVADVPRQLEVAVAHGDASHGGRAARRMPQTREQPHGRRLAGAVGTKEPEDGARRDSQVKAIERDDRPVVLRQAARLDGRGVGGPSQAAGAAPVMPPRDRRGSR